jgi:hypothetical protein
LHQTAMVATEHLPLFHRGHHSCHKFVLRADPEQGPLTRPITSNVRCA